VGLALSFDYLASNQKAAPRASFERFFDTFSEGGRKI